MVDLWYNKAVIKFKNMAKIISSNYLNKKLTGDKLRSKVGRVQINSGGSARALTGTDLKKFITKLGGKTDTQIEKALKEKYGVSGYQVKKRESIMKLIRGDEKSGLTEEQIKRNLKFNIQKDESGLKRPGHEMSFAGGSVASTTIGGARTKGTMGDIGVKRGQTGFARNLGGSKLPGSPVPQAPGGTRPIGL